MLLHNKYTFHEFGLETVRFKGGGSSGKVDYPLYMKTAHGQLLDNNGADTPSSSVIDALNSALSNSPWSGETAYDPTTPLADMWTAVCAYNTVVDALSHTTDWLDAMDNARVEMDSNYYSEEYVANALMSFMQDIGASFTPLINALDLILTDETIVNDVDAYARHLDDEVDNNALTKFRAGMRDINSVNSSTFIIGEALILGMKGRDVAKYESSLRLENYRQRVQLISDLSGKVINLVQLKLADRHERNKVIVSIADQMIKSLLARVDFEKAVATISVDAKTKHIIANKEYQTENLSIAESDAKWDLELFTYPSNVLAAIGGGTVGSGQKQPSTAQSALGGAMSGAAMGASIGSVVPGIGTAIGAIGGAIIGAGAAMM
jgi:hypothetical protein